MKIELYEPVFIYMYRLPQDIPHIVSNEYYWLGDGNVGYMAWNGKMWDWYIALNVFKLPHITHIVPYSLKNKNYGKYINHKRDMNPFIDNYKWEDFKKENIK